MAKDILNRMQQRLDEIESEYNADLSKVEEKLTAATENLKAAEAEMQTAIECEDKKLYAQAKKAKEAAQDDCELYSGKKRMIMSSAKISENESKRFLNDLYADSEQRGKQYHDRMCEILSEMLALHSEFTNSIKSNEAMISKWNSHFNSDQDKRIKPSYEFGNGFYLTINGIVQNVTMRGKAGALKGEITVPEIPIGR